MKPRFILNGTEIERGLRLDREDLEDRALLVSMGDALIDSLELAFDGGISRDDVWLWLDADIGEGSLFRALSAKIPTLLNFDFDIRDYLEVAVEEMNELTTRFKPDVLVLPVRSVASEMGKISVATSGWQSARSMTPIDKHISIFDFAQSFGVKVAWDIRRPRGEWSDPMLQSENALRTISRFQDAGLEPAMWIMNLPSVGVVAEALSARAHIDDRNDVMTCFALETIFWTILRSQSETLLESLPESVAIAIKHIAAMPGNVKPIIGSETYATCLNRPEATIEESHVIASKIARRLIAVSEALCVDSKVEKISV